MQVSIETVVALNITVMIIVANILTLLVLFRTDMLTLLNRVFFASLTVADLCIGFLVGPFSVWTSLFDRWIYGERFCHIEAYGAAIFWIVSVHSLAWLSVDHYVAMRKPDRYDTYMTTTRSACWVVFVWTAAFSFCLSPLFGDPHATYQPEAFVCVIDWSFQKAYFITSGTLIVLPPLVALAFANFYVFTSGYQSDKAAYEKMATANSRPDLYAVNVAVCWVYFGSWLPWCILQLYDAFRSRDRSGDPPPALYFWLTWLAIGNSFWKFVVYFVCFHDFRTGLRILYRDLSCCCCCRFTVIDSRSK